jgi:anti-sigma-K factor RskA
LFSTFTGRLSLAAGAVALIFLLLSGILAANVAQQQAQIAALQRDLAEQQQLVRVLSDPNQVQRKLAGSGIPGAGSVYFDPQKNQAVVVVQDMPALPENEAYQLWLIQGNNVPVPMPTFTVNQNGQAAVVLTAPAGLGTYDVIAITREPHRGSTTPTLPIVMSGKLG